MADRVKQSTQARDTSDLYFGPFRLESTKRLWRGVQLVPLRPRPLAVLRYLAERPGQLVFGEELLKHVWPRIYVTKTVLRVCMSELRQALGENPLAPQFIETVGRQGYRFVAPLATTAQTHPSQQGVESWRLTTPFVGREPELVRLWELFERARRGECQTLFLHGEPGIGKTILVDRFLDQVRRDGQVLIGRGQCIEHFGAGEAYLPLLEALTQLCRGPHGKQVLAALRRHAPLWLAQFSGLVEAGEREALQRQVQGSGRERMLRELAGAIEAVAANMVLVLVLEDLQWSDTLTLEVLAYLAQRQQPARLYILGTYRPVEVVMREHPLRQIVQELSGRGRCSELALELFTEAEVNEYLQQRFDLDATLTKLGQIIYRRTDGNALFVVSFVEYLLQRRLLIAVEGQIRLEIDFITLERLIPNNLQQAILLQVERLDVQERRLLEAASVSGVTFTALEVAQVGGNAVEEVEGRCDNLAAKGLLIEAAGLTEWPDGRVVARYRFQHALYRQILYEQLGQGRRMRLHHQIGECKEGSSGKRAAELAYELATHFTEGRDYRRASHYRKQASEMALQRGAYQEAIAHCHAGLELLARLPDTLEHQRQELAFRKLLNTALIAVHGYTGEDLARNLQHARALCQKIKDSTDLVSVLAGLGRVYQVRADRAAIEEVAEQERRLLESVHDPLLALQLHAQLGSIETMSGAPTRALVHQQQALTLYDATAHHVLLPSFGIDPMVTICGLASWSAWLAGYPNLAQSYLEKGLAHTAALPQPFSQILLRANGAQLFLFRREPDAALPLVQQSSALAREHEISQDVITGSVLQSCVALQRGEAGKEIPAIKGGLEQYRATGAQLHLPFYLSILAEGYQRLGKFEDGLQAIQEALQLYETYFDRYWEAEVYRLKGELLLQQKSPKSKTSKSQAHSRESHSQGEAEACFHTAIEIAHQQEAKSLELRATTSLARLWQQQGKRHEARTALSAIYDWFTEGFDTRDMREAKELLDALDR